MFYVKEKLNDSVEVKIDINGKNVYGLCPRCGCEVPVDLVEFMQDIFFDLLDSAVYCQDCGKRIQKEARRNGHK